MTKNPANLGLILFGITMLIFFVVYYFFAGIHFFDISLKVNAFVFPILYCAVGFASVRNFWKENNGIHFKEAFKRAFYPMFIGGLFSMSSIFVFLNFVDIGAKDLLNHQYIARQKSELDNEYNKAKSILKHDKDKQELDEKYKARLQSFAPDKIANKDMLTASHFAGYFAGIMMFYVVLSAFFGAFFRSRSAK